MGRSGLAPALLASVLRCAAPGLAWERTGCTHGHGGFHLINSWEGGGWTEICPMSHSAGGGGETKAGEGQGLAQAPGYQHRGACSFTEKLVDVPFRGGPRCFPTWS